MRKFALQVLLRGRMLLQRLSQKYKIRVPFWVPIIIRHLLFRVPKKGP